jgi:hypothetical protein
MSWVCVALNETGIIRNSKSGEMWKEVVSLSGGTVLAFTWKVKVKIYFSLCFN